MTLLIAGLSLLLLAGISAAVLATRPELSAKLYRLLFAVGCALAAVPAIRVLGGHELSELRMEAGIPGGAWTFGVDALSALFLLIILSVGAAAAFYGQTYFRRQRGAASAHFFLACLVVSLALVVAARAAMPFLLAWESMAITAYALVVFDHERVETRRAGLLYLVATHTATLALFVGFAVWGTDAVDLTFASLATWRPTGEGATAALLVLTIIGFGLKAGIVPLHFWLPEAHAAAPAHISAIMSGVVIKMGIYGLLRVVALLGAPPAWFGWLILGIGAVSGVLGVLWALGQHDLKRLLAYHSVENIGIILLGLGAGVLGLAYAAPHVALLGFAGAALHTLNHALFKSLLFFGAGAVQHGTGTRDIDRLGGLARWMPRTTAAFLIGSVAIVGLPPLNGFVSEWLVFRSLLSGGFAADGLRLAVLGAASLGLIGALALACFAKVVGIIYLGVPRHSQQQPVHESPAGLLWPQYALAAACIGIGLLPTFVLPPVLRAAAVVARMPAQSLPPDAAAGTLTIFSLALSAALLAAWTVWRWLLRRVPAASGETWACGAATTTARMQYSASSFAAPLLAAYQPIAGIRTHRTAVTLETRPSDPVLDVLLRPAWSHVRSLAQRIRPIQRGRLSLYLVYVMLAVIVLLFYLLSEARTS